MRHKRNLRWMTACALVVSLLLGGCVTTGFKKPVQPQIDVDAQSIRLTKAVYGAPVLIERDDPLSVTTASGNHSPVKFYGVNYQHKTLYVYDRTGQLVGIPMPTIRQIEVIKEGMIGWAALGGGAAGTVVGALIWPSDGLFGGMKAEVILGLALTGAALGTAMGAIMDIDDSYPIGPKIWQIQIPKAKTTPPPKPTGSPPAPDATTAPTDTPTPTSAPTQPATESSETQPTEKPATVQDWIEKKKTDSKKKQDEAAPEKTDSPPTSDEKNE